MKITLSQSEVEMACEEYLRNQVLKSGETCKATACYDIDVGSVEVVCEIISSPMLPVSKEIAKTKFAKMREEIEKIP